MSSKISFRILLISWAVLFTQESKFAGEFLNNAGHARSSALAGTEVVLQNRVNLGISNPASILGNEYPSFVITGEHRFGGEVTFDQGQWASGKRAGNYTIGWVHVGASGIPDTRDALLDYGLDGEPNSEDEGENNGQLDDGERLDPNNITYFSDHELALNFSWGMRRKAKESIGATLKILYKQFAEFRAYGLGFDIAYVRDFPNLNIRYTSILRDPGTTYLFWNTNKTERFKPIIESGIGWKFERWQNLKIYTGVLVIVRTEGKTLSSQFDVLDRFSGEWAFGFEMLIRKHLFLRAGQNARFLLTLGAGVQPGRLNLDYSLSISQETDLLEKSHRLSIGMILH